MWRSPHRHPASAHIPSPTLWNRLRLDGFYKTNVEISTYAQEPPKRTMSACIHAELIAKTHAGIQPPAPAHTPHEPLHPRHGRLQPSRAGGAYHPHCGGIRPPDSPSLSHHDPERHLRPRLDRSPKLPFPRLPVFPQQYRHPRARCPCPYPPARAGPLVAPMQRRAPILSQISSPSGNGPGATSSGPFGTSR